MSPKASSGGPRYTQAFWKRWKAFKEVVGAAVRRNPTLTLAAKVVMWEMIDRANKLDGRAHASSRGLAVDTGMTKNTANDALHLLHERRVIDLENSETEGGARLQATAYLLLDGKRWPGPGPDDIVSQEMGQVAKAGVSQKPVHGVPKPGTGGVPHRRDTRTLLREPNKNLPSGADARASLDEGERALTPEPKEPPLTPEGQHMVEQFNNLISTVSPGAKVPRQTNKTDEQRLEEFRQAASSKSQGNSP
jgi:hypothetical protein